MESETADEKDSRKNVAVVGASKNPERYSYKAIQTLLEKGYRPFPVRPACDEVLGVRCYPTLSEIPEPIDTITLYVNAMRSLAMADEIIALKPRRVIFNPGAENRELAERCRENGIEPIEACTIVMLKTGQF